MNLKLMMYIKTFGMIKINLITQIIMKIVHILINQKKKVIGKFKDEAASILINEFIGLRSKMYSYIKDNNNGSKTAKGIKKLLLNKI